MDAGFLLADICTRLLHSYVSLTECWIIDMVPSHLAKQAGSNLLRDDFVVSHVVQSIRPSRFPMSTGKIFSSKCVPPQL